MKRTAKRKKTNSKERKIKKEVKIRESPIEILKKLISMDTSVPPGRYERAIDYLEAKFKEIGYETQKVVIPREYTPGFKEPRVNLLVHLRNPGKPRLLIYTHIDTVPVKDWDGFRPRSENGKVYGRGAADMKGAIVGLLWALEKIKNKIPAWDISVMVTTDEEVLGQQTAQLEYLGQFLEPLQGAYIWNLDSNAGLVEIADLGSIQMDIEVSGKSVHSALSHLGVNAVEQAFLVAKPFFRLKKEVILRRSRIPVHPNTGIESGVMEPRLNINVFKGGWKTNVVPDKCLISIDRRLIPEENLEEAEKELLRCLTSANRVDWKIRKIFKTTSYATSDPITNKLAKVIKRVTGQKVGKYGGMGSCDLPGVAVKWKAKIFGLGVFRPENNVHGKDEYVYLKDIEDLSEILVSFLLKNN